MKKTEPHEHMTDSDLVRLSDKGDEDAFMTLYSRHQGSVFRFALHMSGRQEIAEEVTQEVFMALLTRPNLYSPDRGALQGYLLGIARNKVRRQLPVGHERVSDSVVDVGSDALFDGLIKAEELAALRQAILDLPPNYREIIVLCDLENLDYAQTADQLGCAVGTVRSRLHRARAILGAKLRKGQRCSV